jgi:hypothetical protein
LAAVSSLSLQQTAMVELAFARANPLPLVALLSTCFLRQAKAPGARREAALDVMYVRGGLVVDPINQTNQSF